MDEKIIEPSQYIIKVVRQVLHNQEVEPPSKDASFSFIDVYKVAKFHQIENLVFFGIEKFIDNEQLLINWKKKNSFNITQVIVQEEEKKVLAEEFEKNDIDFLPVKGYYDRALYPRPDFRFMADLDILFDQKKKATSKKLMESLGYTCNTYNYSKDDTYTKKPFVHVELHRSLFMSYYENYQYYKEIYKKATVSPTNKNHYILNDDDLYLFDLAHLKRHYDEGGAGFRNFIDIYLILTKKKETLHEDYLAQEAEKLGLTDFRKMVESIALEWFGDKEPSDEYKEEKNYIISSGAYGTKYNNINYNLKKNGGSKFKIIYRRAFPEVKVMKGYFPILEKWIILLPFCYIRRLCHGLKKGKCLIDEVNEIKNN